MSLGRIKKGVTMKYSQASMGKEKDNGYREEIETRPSLWRGERERGE
mgnify:CR=1 FL=1